MDSGRIRRWTLVVFALNVALVVAVFAVYFTSESELVLAQGADSVFDLVSGAVLAFSAHVAMQPRDANHPFGHQRAEPIGALVVAVLAGVLGVEVLRHAVAALSAGQGPQLDAYVLAVLSTKLALKAGIFVSIRRGGVSKESPAVQALAVDARNDALICASSVGGYFLVRGGMLWADAVLAMPVGLYIGYSGIELGRENLRYLMGEAPARDVLRELELRASASPGVLRVVDVTGHYVGQRLHVEATILISGKLNATETHDIGLEVKSRLEDHPLVGRAFVHLDTAGAREHET